MNNTLWEVNHWLGIYIHSHQVAMFQHFMCCMCIYMPTENGWQLWAVIPKIKCCGIYTYWTYILKSIAENVFFLVRILIHHKSNCLCICTTWECFYILNQDCRGTISVPFFSECIVAQHSTVITCDTLYGGFRGEWGKQFQGAGSMSSKGPGTREQRKAI